MISHTFPTLVHGLARAYCEDDEPQTQRKCALNGDHDEIEAEEGKSSSTQQREHVIQLDEEIVQERGYGRADEDEEDNVEDPC